MRRGDVVTVAATGDYGKPRPAVIVQTDALPAEHASVVVCQMTSELSEAPEFRVTIEPTKRNGLRAFPIPQHHAGHGGCCDDDRVLCLPAERALEHLACGVARGRMSRGVAREARRGDQRLEGRIGFRSVVAVLRARDDTSSPPWERTIGRTGQVFR